MSKVNKIIDALVTKENVNESTINKTDGAEELIGKSQYFTAYANNGEIELVDLNDNNTRLDKYELKELINLLQKCAKKVK